MTAPAPARSAREQRSVLSRLRRAVGVEAVIIVVVFALTSVLVTQDPSSGEAATPRAAQQVLQIDGESVHADLILTPGKVGINSLQVKLSDADGRPIETFKNELPDLSVALTGTDVGPFRHPLVRTGPGEYEASVDLPLPGTWTIALTVRTGEFDSSPLSTQITIQ